MLSLELDLNVIQTKEELMEWLRKSFDFPSYFGGNWDAVEECLYDSCAEDTEILLMNEDDLSDELETELPRLERILKNFNNAGELSITLIHEED
jgi:RNAse (barnase) inhibitor barstar